MKIGMCTGVYDLFHAGHKNQIKRAYQKCDFLFVAIASDYITQVQKGRLRPIENEALRCQKVNYFLRTNMIPGKAFITDKLDFNGIELVDMFFVGPDQHNVRWNGPKVVIPRTPGISTGMLIKQMEKKR